MELSQTQRPVARSKYLGTHELSKQQKRISTEQLLRQLHLEHSRQKAAVVMSYEHEFKELRSSVQELKRENEEISNDMQDTLQENEELNYKLSEVLLTLNKVIKDREGLHKERDALEQEVELLRESASKCKKHEEMYRTLRTEKEKLEEENEILSSKKVQAEKYANDMSEVVSELQTIADTLLCEKNNLEQKICQLVESTFYRSRAKVKKDRNSDPQKFRLHFKEGRRASTSDVSEVSNAYTRSTDVKSLCQKDVKSEPHVRRKSQISDFFSSSICAASQLFYGQEEQQNRKQALLRSRRRSSDCVLSSRTL